MGTIKDRNGKDLTEAEKIKKRWQKYTKELYQKILNDLDNPDYVVTHIETDNPGGGHGNLLQHFCLENPMDRRAWWVAESWT